MHSRFTFMTICILVISKDIDGFVYKKRSNLQMSWCIPVTYLLIKHYCKIRKVLLRSVSITTTGFAAGRIFFPIFLKPLPDSQQGESWLNADCTERYTCEANDEVTGEDYTCNGVCKPDSDGHQACLCRDDETQECGGELKAAPTRVHTPYSCHVYTAVTATS